MSTVELAPQTPTVDIKATASAPVEEAAQTTQVEEGGESAAPETESESEGTESTETAGAEPEVSKGAEKRIKQLVEKAKEAESRVAMLESMLQQSAQNTIPLPVTLSPEPKADDFESWEAYEAAARKHTVDLTKHEIAKEMSQRQVAQRQTQIDALFKARLEVASAEDPTIAAVFNDPAFQNLPISPMLGQIIKESQFGPQLAKHLNENKALAYQLQNMHPLRVAQEIGKLEYQLSTKPKPEKPEVKHVSQAPTPIKTVTPSGRATVSEENLPIEEFMRRRNAKLVDRQKSSMMK